MIKLVLIGLWVCAVTLGGGYAGAIWQAAGVKTAGDEKKYQGKLTQVRLKPLNVPVTGDGKITGYVVAQLTFTSPADLLKKLSVKPEVFMLDAAFNGIYAGGLIDIAKLDKASWAGLTKVIKDSVNGRFGMEVIHDVVIEEFGYVPIGEVRGRKTGIEAPAGTAKIAKER
jgi:hypothetical protein